MDVLCGEFGCLGESPEAAAGKVRRAVLESDGALAEGSMRSA